jgi:hypothetical protein
VVPAATESCRESILGPMPYAVWPPFSQLTHLSREVRWGKPGCVAGSSRSKSRCDRWVDRGGWSSGDENELLGFGAKITRRKGWGRPGGAGHGDGADRRWSRCPLPRKRTRRDSTSISSAVRSGSAIAIRQPCEGSAVGRPKEIAPRCGAREPLPRLGTTQRW